MYQRKGAAAYKADIGNISAACEYLKNPHQQFKSIHIAGTNGKGSTSHMMASILQEAGYTVGLYTSPHLKDFRERIKINGAMISEHEVITFVAANKIIFETLEMSFFELTVAMAFHHFAKHKVDIAIIETGLGGRLDSTNIINPELAIITNIGLDHTNLLGNTLEKIATEKAGIIKHNTPVIIGRKQKETALVFKNIAQQKKAPLTYAKANNRYTSDLKGNYQAENKATCLVAIQELKKNNWIISEDAIRSGFANSIKNTSLLGRWQTLNTKPLTICDTGHNEDGITEICKQLKSTNYKKLHIVFGTVNDKNLTSILALLPKDATYYFCKANIARAMQANELKLLAAKHNLKGNSYTSVNEAFETAKDYANADDCIYIGGSTFVVAEVL